MPQININNISEKIKEKYKIVNNSFRLTNIKNAELDKKKTPKDLIIVEVGDTKQQDFYPQLKLCRWGDTENDNEVNLSIRLKDNEIGDAQVNTLQNKIKYSKGNIDLEFYNFEEGEGGYKLVWFIKEKPATNKIEFTMQSKSLKFYYQPEITDEEAQPLADKDNISLEEAKRKIRPENIVGSYAVYHDTKGQLNDSRGKDYKVGKAFHIYRPKITDAEGKETWGILKIEKDIYTVTIPQEFLDKAVYPIKSNDTFGYTTKGSSVGIGISNCLRGSEFTLSTTGDVSKLTAALNDNFGNPSFELKGGIYDSSSNLEGGTSGEEYSPDVFFDDWFDANYETPLNLTDADYILVAWTDLYALLRYDSGDTNQGHYDEETYNGFPDPASFTHDNNKYSIYATYEAKDIRCWGRFTQ